MNRTPVGLGDGGKALWKAISTDHTLNAMQKVQLEEACRAKDRLDQLDALLRGDVSVWAEIVEPDGPGMAYLQVSSALDKANATANLMKQLLAALRLPDDQTGKLPQRRGPRGAQKPSVPGVSSLERARQSKTG